MVSSSGKFVRSMILDPEANSYIIEADEAGENYRICWGLQDGGKPTSELPTHLMDHEVKALATDGRYRVIHHAHPANIIMLTFMLPLTDEAFIREFWGMATECPVVSPPGVGMVGWMVPSGRDITVATSKLMKDHDAAAWARHRLFCTGEDFDLTFGLIHTIEKPTEILVKVMSIRPGKHQTIMPKDFRNLTKNFRVSLPEKLLYGRQK